MAARTKIPARSLRFPLNTGNRDLLKAKLDDHDAVLDAYLADAVVALAGTTTYAPGVEYIIPITLPADVVTTKYDFVTSEKIEIRDVRCIKDTAGAANTLQVTTGADVAVTDAMVYAVDTAITRPATIAKATRVFAAGATVRVTATRAAGTNAGSVDLVVIKRP